LARAFVAIVPPHDVLDAVGKLSWRVVHQPRELALPRLFAPRYTLREQWHLTVQFLGTRVDLDAAAALLTTVRADTVRVRLGGLGGFPSEKRANVLWLGVVDGRRELARVAAVVAATMAPLVGETEALPFHPHLTLARLGRSADVRAAATACRRTLVGPHWPAGRLVLFESVTASTGAQYRAHAEVLLGS
jgi:2'-5' RNA ligase